MKTVHEYSCTVTYDYSYNMQHGTVRKTLVQAKHICCPGDVANIVATIFINLNLKMPQGGDVDTLGTEQLHLRSVSRASLFNLSKVP